MPDHVETKKLPTPLKTYLFILWDKQCDDRYNLHVFRGQKKYIIQKAEEIKALYPPKGESKRMVKVIMLSLPNPKTFWINFVNEHQKSMSFYYSDGKKTNWFGVKNSIDEFKADILAADRERKQ